MQRKSVSEPYLKCELILRVLLAQAKLTFVKKQIKWVQHFGQKFYLTPVPVQTRTEIFFDDVLILEIDSWGLDLCLFWCKRSLSVEGVLQNLKKWFFYISYFRFRCSIIPQTNPTVFKGLWIYSHVKNVNFV